MVTFVTLFFKCGHHKVMPSSGGEETLTTEFREQPSAEFTIEKEVEREALNIKLARFGEGHWATHLLPKSILLLCAAVGFGHDEKVDFAAHVKISVDRDNVNGICLDIAFGGHISIENGIVFFLFFGAETVGIRKSSGSNAEKFAFGAVGINFGDR